MRAFVNKICPRRVQAGAEHQRLWHGSEYRDMYDPKLMILQAVYETISTIGLAEKLEELLACDIHIIAPNSDVETTCSAVFGVRDCNTFHKNTVDVNVRVECTRQCNIYEHQIQGEMLRNKITICNQLTLMLNVPVRF